MTFASSPATVAYPPPLIQHLDRCVTEYLPREVENIKPDMPLFWFTFGQRRQGLVRRPMEGKNVWQLCKTYRRLIGYPMLEPHDHRHGVAMEVYEQHGDLEHARPARPRADRDDAALRPDPAAALKKAVEFYEAKALDVLSRERGEKTRFVFESARRRDSNMQPPNINKIRMVAPTRFEPVFPRRRALLPANQRLAAC